MRKRIVWLDIAKAIGIISIVLGHCSKGGLYCFCFSFNTILFFILAGLTFGYIDLQYIEKDGIKHYGKFIKKKARSLLIPYAVWALISIILFQFLGNMTSKYLEKSISDSTIMQNLLGGLYANSEKGHFEWNRPLWFLPCLFLLESITYGFIIVLKRLLRSIRTAAVIFMMLGFAFIFIYYYFLKWILPFELETSLNMLGFFGAGICGYLYKEDIKKAATWIRSKIIFMNKGLGIQQFMMAVIFIAIGILLGACRNGTDTRTDQFGNLFVYIPIGLCESVGIILFSKVIAGRKAAAVLSYMGSRTLAILVMHKFPVLFFQTLCPFTKVWLNNGNNLAALAIAVVTIILCLTVEHFVSMFIPFVYGKKYGKPIHRGFALKVKDS